MALRHDESQYFALKTAIEGILGHEAWLDLKECTEVATWRRYFLKTIQAIRVSIEASVEICDQRGETKSTRISTEALLM